MDIESGSSDATVADAPANTNFQSIDQNINDEMKRIIWGNNIKEDVFERWSQGILIFF